MKLSIIIPSYNMGSKIDQCLKSIFESNADKSEYEVVVFDSSNDSSENILVEYAKKYSNITVVKSKIKTPAGIARNHAVKYAKGDYIYCVDIDDKLTDNALPKILKKLDGTIDMYFCPYRSKKENKDIMLKLNNRKDFATYCPAGVMAKLYKRKFYTNEPNYTPEDVSVTYLTIDKCETFDYFDFVIYEYDNTAENTSAISRTFDWLKCHPSNLMVLATDNVLEKLNLRDEYLAGVLHNFADMYAIRNSFKNVEVKDAFMQRFYNTYQNIMSGIYVH